MRKQDMLFAILKIVGEQPNQTITGEGVLEVLPDGFGFLRSPEANYLPGPRRYLCLADRKCANSICAPAIRSKAKSARPRKANVISPAQGQPDQFRRSRKSPPPRRFRQSDRALSDQASKAGDAGPDQERIYCAHHRSGLPARQRPARLDRRAAAHRQNGDDAEYRACDRDNHPEVYLIVLLIDERPEEVTDMARSVKGEVISSTFDEPATRHVQVAEMVIEKAKRLVEHKRDVVILLDSITRLARAYNTVVPSSGKVLTGGVDANALQRPKRFFGAARNIEEGGSLTIIATALIDTGSRMDEVIFEEFKGTGNSEIILDRKLSDRRTFPAIDITKSGTRKEELLVDKATMSKMWVLRRVLLPMGVTDAMEFLLDKLKYSKTNGDFFDSMGSGGGNEKAAAAKAPHRRCNAPPIARRSSSSGSTNSPDKD